ncbi:hypothetical protein FHS55_002281 [Angulomicrobium tetraedrale]|uniref:WbqC-like protein n=1 Tax=Ancylobacter tetraedralis TaxID=217068 RepID=A0A839ZAC9_9HYPH|nr:WbqC family protein [Ancylobacter tetraedralis]MBB3771672.1 hypothetical protein [Ancylobacter tetraedralis]
MTKIAIMQPYFLPYAGYFRLLNGVDCFVVLDTVQYSNRGWINRNQLISVDGAVRWINAPFSQPSRGTPISEVQLLPDAEVVMQERMRRFSACTHPTPELHSLVEAMALPQLSAVDYLVGLLDISAKILKLNTPVIRASSLDIDPTLRASQRILGICKHLNAEIYINAPGGAELYDWEEFSRHGIDLRILPAYAGSNLSVLQCIYDIGGARTRAEIDCNMGA